MLIKPWPESFWLKHNYRFGNLTSRLRLISLKTESIHIDYKSITTQRWPCAVWWTVFLISTVLEKTSLRAAMKEWIVTTFGAAPFVAVGRLNKLFSEKKIQIDSPKKNALRLINFRREVAWNKLSGGRLLLTVMRVDASQHCAGLYRLNRRLYCASCMLFQTQWLRLQRKKSQLKLFLSFCCRFRSTELV